MLNSSGATSRGGETRTKLLDATIRVIREVGFGRLSARAIADAAGVNQALIFYHFGSMDDLLAEACRKATAERVAVWAAELDEISDLSALVSLGRRLHAKEAEEGNVTVLAQALAASQSDPALARVVGDALQLWLEPLTTAATRITKGTILDGVLAPSEIARSVAATFVGLELFEDVVPNQDGDAFSSLERFAALGALALEAGPITKSALRRRLRSSAAPGSRTPN